MILGRNTQQWMGLITSVIGFVAFVIQVVAPNQAGAAGLILSALTGVLGIFISFVANTYTTPVASPQLLVGTVVAATNDEGVVVGHVKVPTPSPAPEALDVGEQDGQP